MAHDPAQTPEEIYNDSPVVRHFLQEVQSRLKAGENEVTLPASYPDDFVKRTIEHFSVAGWKVTNSTAGKLSFTAVTNPTAAKEGGFWDFLKK